MTDRLWAALPGWNRTIRTGREDRSQHAGKRPDERDLHILTSGLNGFDTTHPSSSHTAQKGTRIAADVKRNRLSKPVPNACHERSPKGP